VRCARCGWGGRRCRLARTDPSRTRSSDPAYTTNIKLLHGVKKQSKTAAYIFRNADTGKVKGGYTSEKVARPDSSPLNVSAKPTVQQEHVRSHLYVKDTPTPSPALVSSHCSHTTSAEFPELSTPFLPPLTDSAPIRGSRWPPRYAADGLDSSANSLDCSRT
jgi:hypothetical protein